MTTPLFRAEALGQQATRGLGVTTGLNPVALSLLCWLLVSLIIMILIFLIKGQFPRSVEVSGVLVANRGTIDIKAPVGGVVSTVSVDTGDTVARGGLLLKIEPDMRQVESKRVVLTALTENRAQQALLEDRRSGRNITLDLKQAQVKSREQALRTQWQALQALAAKEADILGLEQARHNRLQQLQAHQLLALDRLEQSAMTVMKQEKLVLRSRQDLADTERQLQVTEEERALLLSEFRDEATELAMQLSGLVAQEAELLANLHQELAAPVAGTITLIRVKSGESVSAGQMLGSLQHAESRLQAELYIPSRAVGFLARGQRITLQLDAFPYQKFGLLVAELSELAGSVVSVGSDPLGGRGGAYYLAKAELTAQDISGFGQDLPLRAGMELQARIMLEQRNLLEWLFEPLLVNGRLALGR